MSPDTERAIEIVRKHRQRLADLRDNCFKNGKVSSAAIFDHGIIWFDAAIDEIGEEQT